MHSAYSPSSGADLILDLGYTIMSYVNLDKVVLGPLPPCAHLQNGDHTRTCSYENYMSSYKSS